VTYKFIIGVDEAGCGSLIGSLIIAAVAFPADALQTTAPWKSVYGAKTLVAGDSKGVKNPAHRAALSVAIQNTCAALVVVEKTSTEIDARLLGTVLPEAIQLAAARCLERLSALNPALCREDFLVRIDGDLAKPDLPCVVQCIPDGDKLDWRIGAASIIAKATHDKRIDALHAEYPNWGFDRSRGYPTREHKAFLALRGATRVHRKSYQPVRNTLPIAKGIET
jgi:ribonuclease HII